MEEEKIEPVNCAAVVRAVKDAGDMIIVNDCHVISIMQDDAWKDNSFIVQYKQEGEE